MCDSVIYIHTDAQTHARAEMNPACDKARVRPCSGLIRHYQGLTCALLHAVFISTRVHARAHIDASYEEKHCSQSWTKTSRTQNLGRK